MHFDIISIFPEYFQALKTQGLVGRAYQQRRWSMQQHNPRQFAGRQDGRIDDRPFGGGAGMVMRYQPLVDTLVSIQQSAKSTTSKVICFSPAGKPLQQQDLTQLVELSGLILVCGRYQGIDQRFIDNHVDQQISLGDFVVSGGELAALCLMDALIRLLPQVLGNSQSAWQQSFSGEAPNLLDFPHYTRPQSLSVKAASKQGVPGVLLSGDHAKISLWRRWQALRLTQCRRPELLTLADRQTLAKLEREFS